MCTQEEKQVVLMDIQFHQQRVCRITGANEPVAQRVDVDHLRWRITVASDMPRVFYLHCVRAKLTKNTPTCRTQHPTAQLSDLDSF